MDSTVYKNLNHTEIYYSVTEDPLREFGMLEILGYCLLP